MKEVTRITQIQVTEIATLDDTRAQTTEECRAAVERLRKKQMGEIFDYADINIDSQLFVRDMEEGKDA